MEHTPPTQRTFTPQAATPDQAAPASQAPARLLHTAKLLRLQRSAGNQAVGRWLHGAVDRSPASAAGRNPAGGSRSPVTVQRMVTFEGKNYNELWLDERELLDLWQRVTQAAQQPAQPGAATTTGTPAQQSAADLATVARRLELAFFTRFGRTHPRSGAAGTAAASAGAFSSGEGQ
jgi:hypothetical protein